jgi:hypothetical protein
MEEVRVLLVARALQTNEQTRGYVTRTWELGVAMTL